MKVDNNFTPCPVTDGDELYPNGIFVFNITRMLEYIKKNPNDSKLEEIKVSDIRNGFSSITESHLNSIDVSRPVIIAEIAPGKYNLIDGNHRVEKAYRTSIENVLAYRLNVEQHMKFLTCKKAYISYVEYWNSKLEK